ncbi:hypothetical protein WJX81_006320 [Elliptochloris bilobata]|uniref:RPA43 OB domain-containing protein n=1 Tax=Elliptochloris bilobata TaxID=381761 RepID=A0AAW1R012_9CHLO
MHDDATSHVPGLCNLGNTRFFNSVLQAQSAAAAPAAACRLARAAQAGGSRTGLRRAGFSAAGRATKLAGHAAFPLVLDLSPYCFCDALDGVREQLDAQLNKWSDVLDGALIAYAKERIVSLQATIHPYFPYIHVDVSAQVLVFAPRVGYSMSGKVNSVDADFIGLEVLDVFNAAIGRQNIRPEYTFRKAGERWVNKRDASAAICVGTTVVFEVTEVRDEGGFFFLIGSGGRAANKGE